MAPVFYFPLIGTPTAEGNLLSFYEAGLDVPLDVWTDSDRSIPFSQPIVLNAAGESDGPIYVSDSPSYKVKYTDSNGVAIAGYPVDFVAPSTIINVTTVSTTVLTNAQIKALPTTPITLVAAPAAGLRIRIFAVSLRSSFAAGAYTNINTTYNDIHAQGNFVLYGLINDSAATPIALTQATDFWGSTTPKFADLLQPVSATFGSPGAGGYVVANLDAVTDQAATALALAMDNNGSGALTGGNAANTLTAIVYYALESVL